MIHQYSKPRPMTPEELFALKVGDTVFARNLTLTVVKVGRKYITTDFKNIRIDAERARIVSEYILNLEIYRDAETKQAYDDYCRSVDEARSYIRDHVYRLTAEELIKVKEFIENLKKEKGA